MNYLQKIVFALFCSMALVSCVDSDYDMSKDVDMTMGLGSNGLAVSLGATEKMYLKDLLKVEDSDMLETTEDKLYYLIKGGTSSFNVKVNDIEPFKMDPIDFTTSAVYVNSTGSDLTMPIDFSISAQADGSGSTTLNILNIPNEVKEISKISIAEGTKIVLSCLPDNAFFNLEKMENVVLTFPNNIWVKDETGKDSHTYTVASMTSMENIVITISRIEFEPTEGAKLGYLVKNHTVSLVEKVSANGRFTISGKSGAKLQAGESVKIRVGVSFPNIELKDVSGIVSPNINPTVNPIEIGTSLPDFLQDNSVELHVANPTLRFDVSGSNLPIPLLFSADLNSVKGTELLASVTTPTEGKAHIAKGTNTSTYFYQETAPWDPMFNQDAVAYQVNDLSTLVEKLPDVINVDISTGHIVADESVEHTLTLGRTYEGTIDYKALVPFRFNANTQIVYTDSCESMNDDLKDYQADGVTVTALAQSTIPMKLTVELIPLDIQGREISGLHISTSEVEPGSSTEVKQTNLTMTLKADHPSDVSLLDKIRFKIYCKSETPDELYSDQYVEVKNIRLKLNGQIVGNFN